jgi:Zn-dependent membrane protease YugP
MQQKDHLVFLANRFAIAGLGALALAMTGAIVLITNVLFGATATIVTGIAAFSVFVLFWYALPLKRRFSSEEEPDPPK